MKCRPQGMISPVGRYDMSHATRDDTRYSTYIPVLEMIHTRYLVPRKWYQVPGRITSYLVQGYGIPGTEYSYLVLLMVGTGLGGKVRTVCDTNLYPSGSYISARDSGVVFTSTRSEKPSNGLQSVMSVFPLPIRTRARCKYNMVPGTLV